MPNKINKAVFPVAGLGSRFLPATKANPKEMLPIVDKPLIQYAVEEAVAAGIKDLIFVTSSSKRAIEDYFDSNHELEARLIEQDKQALLDIIRNILPKGVHCVYVRQPEPLGLGDAVYRAQACVGDGPFAVLLADDLIDCPGAGCLQQIIEMHQQTQGSVIAVEEIATSETHKYGIVAMQGEQVTAIVEKPASADAPSRLGVAGRYVLTPAIFACLQHTSVGAGGEIQLTDAISRLIQQEKVYAKAFIGKRYDCGDKLGYLQATIAYALKHPELAADFKQYLAEL